MKKTLNETGITNELRGQSAFFPKEATAPVGEEAGTAAASSHADERRNEQTNVRINERSGDRSNERSNVRKKIRHTFDIYHDQLLSLRELALNREVLFGERVLLGDLVQEALDMLITKERNTEQTNE
jgi:hypothetical protein